MSYRQPGITNRPPEHLLLTALDFVDRSPTGAAVALDGLANVVQRELSRDLDPRTPPHEKDQPPAEPGELGFDEGYDRGFLTITVGLASSAFDVLGVAQEARPADLRPIPWDKLGDSPQDPASGDVIVQVCSDDVYVCEHVVRKVEQKLGASFRVAWTQIGGQRYTSRPGRTSREEGRALIGFLDGTSNLNPRRSEDDATLVFVDPGAVATYPQNPPPQPGQTGPYANIPGGPRFPVDLASVPTQEPEWTRGGTYMTVRVSTFQTAPWDHLSLNQQEQSVGRFKWSGASLDREDHGSQLDSPPVFESSQDDVRVPLASHVRKANPRLSDEDQQRRLFRRGYPLIASGTGGLTRGLAFIAFARTTSTQFEFIFRAWLRNPDFPSAGTRPDQLLFGTLPETVLCGGYYFVPPIKSRNRPWTWRVP